MGSYVHLTLLENRDAAFGTAVLFVMTLSMI